MLIQFFSRFLTLLNTVFCPALTGLNYSVNSSIGKATGSVRARSTDIEMVNPGKWKQMVERWRNIVIGCMHIGR